MDNSTHGKPMPRPVSTPDLSKVSPMDRVRLQAAYAALSSNPQGSQVLQNLVLRLLMPLRNAMQANPPPKPQEAAPPPESDIQSPVRSKSPVVPRPTTPKKQKRKLDFSLESTRMKRSKSTVVPPRNIKTPEWSAVDETDLDAVAVDPFDFTEKHKQLEVFESRIQFGDDVYQHPIMALAALEQTSGNVLSKAEVELADRYEEVVDTRKAPKFWPSRIWDNPDTVMGDEESQILKRRITTVIDEIDQQVAELARTKPVRRNSHTGNTRTRNNSTMIHCDFTKYETDSDCTDIDD